VGQQIDFSSATYATSQSVVQAAMYGHCSECEASSILAERLEAAPDQLSADKIRGAMDMLKLAKDSLFNEAQGVLMYVWAKVSCVVSKRGDGTVKLTAGGDSKAKSLSVTMARPSTESGFFELLHLFQFVVVALGIVRHLIVSRFIDDVVWGAMRLKESWQCAHELLLVYLREIDFDSTRTLTMANVFRRGGQDTLLTEARRNAAAFFRPLGGNPRPVGAPPAGGAAASFNGKSKKPCTDFNAGRPCTRVDASGRCEYNHKCNQWVSDKGPAGVCFGAHARCDGCTYDESKRVKKPATE
jgi:hypothetical protein